MPSTASFSGKRMLIEINKVMDSMEAKHRSAFLDSIQKLTGNIELLAIVNDIRSGAITKIDGGVLARIDKVQVDMASLTQISRQAMGLGGKITAKTVGLEGAFDVTNEMAIDAARTISANLANVLKKSVARTIGSIIQDAVSGVDSPYETVKRIQSEIGLTPAHAQSVKIYRQNLIQSGVDKARAIKQAEAYAKRLLKYRARTIARTEVSIAVNVGQLEFWKQMLSRGSLPANTKRVWIAELDGKVCGVCKPLNGELASIDGYWVTAGGSFDIPHAHPNCRCTSGLVFPTPFSKADDAGYESWVISKGESAGHPFRGNQYTGGISAGVSSFNAPYGSVDIEYGELNFNVLTSSVDPTDENWEHAYTEFSEWQGNYRMRHASAALMGMKSPKAHGGEVGDVGANEIIRTGKVGDPFNGHYSVDEAKESIVKAYVGLKRVEESPPSTLPLYRGMVVDGKSSILSSPIGEEFVMPLTSFSYSKIVATEFAGGGFSSTNSEETVKKSTPVLVVLRKGARAADASYTDSIEINGSWVEVPIESVTQGKFRIVSRRKIMLPEGSGFRIEIEQIGVYSMDKNTFISKMTQKIPDWVWEMNGSFAQKISKGESAGHPFRGNQYVEGISGASEFSEEEFDGFARKTGLSWDSFPKPLKQYAFVSYEAVNSNLRRGKGKPETFFDEQVIEAWASVAQEFPSDSIVYRGVTIDLPSPDFVVGDIIQNNGFTSTSRKEETAREFTREFIRIGNPTNKAGVLYKITIPKGTRAVPMINDNIKGGGEDEILFAPTLKLKITKIEKVQVIYREKVQGNFREKVQEIYRVEAEVVGYETDATIENKKLIYKGDKDKSEFIGNYKEMKKRYQSEEYWEIVSK